MHQALGSARFTLASCQRRPHFGAIQWQQCNAKPKASEIPKVHSRKRSPMTDSTGLIPHNLRRVPRDDALKFMAAIRRSD